MTVAIAASVCHRSELENCDVACLALGEADNQIFGGGEGCSCARDIALPHQDLCVAGMRQGEVGIGGDGAVIGCGRAGIKD